MIKLKLKSGKIALETGKKKKQLFILAEGNYLVHFVISDSIFPKTSNFDTNMAVFKGFCSCFTGKLLH